jgi:superfamily II DNA helicase RecQ
MKCKVFKIHLTEETSDFEGTKLNNFLESVKVNQTFASVVNNEFWSVLVFYEDLNASAQNDFSAPIRQTKAVAARVDEAAKPAPPEPLPLSPEQEQKFNNLKQWRNDRAAQDGLPPYMIAHNDSLRQIACAEIENQEDLISIKGFGEKRAQKYGEQIIQILSE